MKGLPEVFFLTVGVMIPVLTLMTIALMIWNEVGLLRCG